MSFYPLQKQLLGYTQKLVNFYTLDTFSRKIKFIKYQRYKLLAMAFEALNKPNQSFLIPNFFFYFPSIF